MTSEDKLARIQKAQQVLAEEIAGKLSSTPAAVLAVMNDPAYQIRRAVRHREKKVEDGGATQPV